jgi:acetyl-CoA C-acetyltransferase
MVDACRQDPGSIGMVSALGWYVTKHSIGVYSTTPPQRGFTRVDAAGTQASVDALPGRQVAGAYSGTATVEATAVVFEREGAPAVTIMSTITPDGRRALANTRDAAVMRDMTEKAWEGQRVALRTDGTVNTLDA